MDSGYCAEILPHSEFCLIMSFIHDGIYIKFGNYKTLITVEKMCTFQVLEKVRGDHNK